MYRNFFAAMIARPLREAASVLDRISGGDFSARLRWRSKGPLGIVAKSINSLAEHLGHRFSELENEKDRLAAILDDMVEGVLVTDDRGEIVLVNPALKRMLCLEGGDCLGRTILECFRNQTVHEAVQNVLDGAPESEREIEAQIGLEERHLIIHTASLHREGKSHGSVSVFYDVTSLRRLENIRREFVANVSHEFKTPLTNILGYAETLMQGALKDEEVALRFIGKIEKNAHHLKDLVEDILKLSEIETGRLEIRPASILLYEAASSIVSDFEGRSKSGLLCIAVDIPKGLEANADPAAVRQILVNLIDNAVKYTSEGGAITVTGGMGKKGKIWIEVTDTGVGISEQDLPRIFERFYRADKARTREIGGTGLGLSIVKHLVQAQGGEITVSSRIGEGTRFRFTLPR